MQREKKIIAVNIKNHRVIINKGTHFSQAKLSLKYFIRYFLTLMPHLVSSGKI